MSPTGLILGAVLGAIVGSFLATLVIRMPRGEQAVTGRSRCDHCRRELAAHELVPVLAHVWLGGRCPACKARIDPVHWQVELSAALVGGLSLGLAWGWTGLALALFGWLMVPLAWLDWRHFWLPDRLLVPLAIGGLALGGVLGPPLPDRLLGGLAGWGALTLLVRAYRKLRGREGLGQGDAKLLGAIGLWLGWVPLAPILALAALLGIAVALARGLERTDALPFGTMLAAAAWITALALSYAPPAILS